MTWETDLQEFLESLSAQNKSIGTIQMYRFHLQNFLSTTDKETNQIKPQDIYAYLNKKDSEIKTKKMYTIKREQLSSNTKHLILACIRKFLDYHKRYDLAKELRQIKIKIQTNEPVQITNDEAQSLIKQKVTTQPQLNERNTLLVKLLFDSGMRRSEVTSLTFEIFKNIDPDEENHMIIVKGKGDKQRKILIPMKWIQEYLDFAEKYGIDISDEKQPLFQSERTGESIKPITVTHIISQLAEEGNVVYNKHVISPHKLRSTYATNLHADGEDVLKIKDLLGHASLNTTKRYVSISNEELKKTKIKAL